jgi:hypothetical protein
VGGKKKSKAIRVIGLGESSGIGYEGLCCLMGGGGVPRLLDYKQSLLHLNHHRWEVNRFPTCSTLLITVIYKTCGVLCLYQIEGLPPASLKI